MMLLIILACLTVLFMIGSIVSLFAIVFTKKEAPSRVFTKQDATDNSEKMTVDKEEEEETRLVMASFDPFRKYYYNSETLSRTLHRVSSLFGDAEIPYFACFGTLLGLVRNGSPIDGDDDVDFAIEASHYAQVKSLLAAQEDYVINLDAENVFVQFRGEVTIDCYFYTEHYDDAQRPYLCFLWHFDLWRPTDPPELAMHIPRSLVYPVQNQVPFGNDILVNLPADPAGLAEFLYGTRWRERLTKHEYCTGIVNNTPVVTYRDTMSSYWDSFYGTSKSSGLVGPSQFAQYVAQEYLKDKPGKLLDLGCGNGRDTFYFAQEYKCPSTGIDGSQSAVQLNNSRAHPLATFRHLDLAKLPSEDEEKYQHIYCRWVLHSVSPTTQDIILRYCATHLDNDGCLFLETRTVDDPLYQQGTPGPDRDSFITDHYRRFLRPEELVAQLESLGFNMVYQEASNGFSPDGGTDTHLVRIVAQLS